MRNMHGSRPVRATAALVMSTALMTGLGTVSNAAPAPLNQLRKLAREAERTSEKIHHANDDLQKAKRDEAAAKKAIAKASKDAAIAEHKREGMQEPLNKIASINLRNGQTAGVVRVLMADSPQEILDQSRSEAAMTQTTLNILVDYEKVVNSAHQAQRTAAENREKAVKAQAQARKAQRDLNKERITMRKRIAAVRSEFASLPPSQRDSWKRVKLPAGFDPKIAFGNNILGNKALQIAMTRMYGEQLDQMLLTAPVLFTGRTVSLASPCHGLARVWQLVDLPFPQRISSLEISLSTTPMLAMSVFMQVMGRCCTLLRLGRLFNLHRFTTHLLKRFVVTRRCADH